MPIFLKTYAQQVDDLLGEYRQNSRGLIQIQNSIPSRIPTRKIPPSSKASSRSSSRTASGFISV
jgi:hypothetical protein